MGGRQYDQMVLEQLHDIVCCSNGFNEWYLDTINNNNQYCYLEQLMAINYVSMEFYQYRLWYLWY